MITTRQDSAAPQSETTPDAVELTILMPCLNEAETLEVCIRKARGFLESSGVSGEVLIADNGSTDGSQAIAERSGARVVPITEKGYGAALLGGIAGARGRYIIMGDADDSYDFVNLSPFVEKLREGFDLVMGNRFRGGIAPGAMPPLHRYLGNPVLTTIGRVLFPSPCGDFHCGLRGFSKTAAKRMDLRTTGMEFASEMVVKATLFKMRIAEVPTTLSPDGRSRPPHLRSWSDGWRHLRFLLMYSPRWLFLYPGLVLMLGGLGLGLALLPGPLHLGAVTLDVHTLLYAAVAVALGYQSITFGLFTKVFAMTEGLLPEDERFNRVFKYVTLETGLIAGVLVLLMGIGGTAWAFVSWSQARFGPQEPRDLLRIVIPSVFAVLLGSQTILSSFFLSVLGLRRKG
jgi:glycosyltransferase involved in cell wall biosynthesis